MADIKGVAELFGMNAGEFAEFTGYSRQELHRVLDNGKAVGTARMADTIRKLDAASYDMYSAAVSQAENSKRSREEFMRNLSNICGLCYQTGPCTYIRQFGHPGWQGSKCNGFVSPPGLPAERCETCEKWYYKEN